MNIAKGHVKGIEIAVTLGIPKRFPKTTFLQDVVRGFHIQIQNDGRFKLKGYNLEFIIIKYGLKVCL